MALCILCGQDVPPGGMLGHKRIVHGEASGATNPKRRVAQSRRKVKKKRGSVWAISGGLPSLGKNSK